MSEMTQQKQVTILLAVVAVLLVVIVGILIWKANALPDPTVSATSQTAANNVATAPQTNATGIQAAAPEFDEATAPKVPADQTPEQYVSQYYQYCVDKDYDSAFVMLPTATQTSYGDSASYAAQLEGYGITGYSVEPQVEQDGTIYVVGTQDTPAMPISYTWTFVKGADGSWLTASRDMGGM